MAAGVEHHPDSFLWLVSRESGTGVLGPFDSDIESSTVISRCIIICCSPSHQTAARVHQIAVPEDIRVQHVTVTREQRRRNRPGLHFYSRSLGCGEVEKRDGVPITTVARTLADLATSLERVPAVWALDGRATGAAGQRSTAAHCSA